MTDTILNEINEMEDEELNGIDYGFSVRSYLTDLFKQRYAKKQKTDWITDLLSLSDSFHERKIAQMIVILSKGSREKPVYIGELAYCVKDKRFTKFDKSLSRVNQLLEIYVRLLYENDLIAIESDALYLGEDDDAVKNTTYGFWLKDDVKLVGFEMPEERGLRDVLDKPQDYQGEMLSDKYSKQIARENDRCAETISLLNHTAFGWDKRICEYEARPEEGESHKQAFEYYEGRVLKKIKLGKVFYLMFAPDKRLRLYVNGDIGNYIGLKQVRARITLAHNEVFKPDMIED